MSRFLPKSLFGQTLLILLTGLILSQAAGWWIYTSDREQAVRAVGGLAAAQRIANLTQLVQEAPNEWRARLVAALSDPTFQVSLVPRPPAIADSSDASTAARVIRDFLAEQLAAGSARRPLVSVSDPDNSYFPGHLMGPGPMMMHGFGGFENFGLFRELRVAVPLSDGEWLAFATTLPETGPAVSRQFLVSMGVMAFIILAASVWAVRRVTAPLASLSTAAERLGQDLNATPISETGSIETRHASRAFNAMQARLRSLIENRTRMLAAISHDLRTSLTLLRLRTENVDDPAERDKMLATITEMNAMVAATLQFASDDAKSETRRPTDLAALVQSVVDDMADMGLAVTMQPAASVVLDCRPDALRRALRNLIDNAVTYGKSAHVKIETTPKSIAITIDDEGSGIPPEELERVFQPFYRIDASRNTETGGIGLGLAIALSIVQAHGGELRLVNRTVGGLRASVVLPR